MAEPSPTRPRPTLCASLMRMGGALLAVNLGAWLWALIAFHDHPALLGTALVAYGFGLRHAVDADHIAAIDNVTRKMMQEGQRPVAVGLFFALGHSSIVIVASAAIAAAAISYQAQLIALRDLGGFVGTLVSALFLLAIALMNLVILGRLWRRYRAVRRGGELTGDAAALAPGGPLTRLVQPLFRLIRTSWHMYPLGVLFGLGFDTATEIGLLGISAAGATQGLPIWSIMVFPILFTAGMTLIDTADGVLMLGAYDWAFARPLRRLTYNMVITAISAALALVVGGIETLGLIGDRFSLEGAFWDLVGAANDNFGLLGAAIIVLLAACWLGSAALARLRGEHYKSVAPSRNG